jgi:hypothetical protein
MATAATSLLGLALPVTGELSGTWGDTVNVSITALLDTAVAGTTTLSSDADVTLTTTTLAANQARQAIILWTAGGTVTRTITVPAQSKSYIVINKTSSSQSIKIVGVGPTTGVTIVAGTAAFVVWNGVDFVTASVTSTTGILPVANGGTGLASGTSGGVLAYTATGTLASSTALAASALVIGGGAGAAPSTTTTGTGVVTALGVNTGTAGAFVVNGGALGSPSTAGTMPAFTLGGTVSGGGNQINNVVIGTTTPLAGAFTTLGVTGTARFGSAGAAPNDFNVITSNVGGSIYTFDNSNTTAGTSTLNAYLRAYGASDVSIIMQTAAGASGQIYAFGIDNSDASSFVISPNTSLGTSNILRLTATGTLSGGTSGTGYSFSGSAPATSLTLDASGNLSLGPLATNFTFTNGSAVSIAGSGTGIAGNGTNLTLGAWNGPIVFQAGNSAGALVERARIDSSGNLGIGTTGPGARLESAGNFRVTNATQTNSAIFQVTSDATGSNGVNLEATYYGAGGFGPIKFTTGGSERMRLDSSGNLGIGTTSPATFSAYTKLSVVNGIAIGVDASNGGRIVGSTTTGTELSYLTMGGNYNLGATGEIALATSTAKSIIFGTNNTERARIDSSGNLLVGTTTANGQLSIDGSSSFGGASSNSAYGIVVCAATNSSGNAVLFRHEKGSTNVGSITTTASLTLYNTTSDQRLKENIQDADSASSLIDALQVRKFDWKADSSHQRYGFVAQELVTVAPEAVHQPADADEMMAVDYSKLVPMLVKELQSLRARVAQLESKP